MKTINPLPFVGFTNCLLTDQAVIGSHTFTAAAAVRVARAAKRINYKERFVFKNDGTGCKHTPKHQ